MGIKISELPNNALPYSGSEELPLVQAGETRAATLSSLVNYLSGALVSESEFAPIVALSGRWQSSSTVVIAGSANWNNTYSAFSAASSNYAVKNANNNFSASQTIVGNLSVASVNIDSIYNVNGSGTSISLSEIDGTGYHSVEMGVKGNPLAYSPIGLNVAVGYGILPANSPDRSVIIGTYAGNNAYGLQGCVMIGYQAGENFGHAPTDINNIFIGNNAGSNVGTGAANIGNIFIGTNAGSNIIANPNENILIGNNTKSYYNHGIVIGNDSEANHHHVLVLGKNILTDEPSKIYIGSSTYPYINHSSTSNLSSYGVGGFTKLKVKVNGSNYYIPLLPS